MADTSLFGRLRRLFSTDVVIRNVGGNQLKVTDSNQIQSLGQLQTNSLFDRFNKLYSTVGGVNYVTQQQTNFPSTRIQLYTDYEAMDTDAIVASALDIVADEATLRNDMSEVLQIRSSDETVQKILYNLFYDVLNIEFNLWSWTRNMIKYGDFYLKLEISEKFGVYNVVPFSSYTILRLEGTDPANPSDVKFKYDPSYSVSENALGFQQINPSVGVNTGSEVIFDNYEMAHFRLLSDFNYLPYGRSYLEPARKIWKQMTLMEDAMLIHRIVRAPEKRTFFVNVGNIPPNEVETYMQRMINKMKKTPYVDPNTGEYNLKFNMQNILEDFYIPVRGGDQTTRIETTKGLDYAAIEDVTYLRDKLFAALKVPKAFLGYEADLEGKATLAAEDIRFARTVERIQRILISELTKIALVHLYSQGYDGGALTNFELQLTTPSIIYDQERIALLKEKVDLAGMMMDQKLMPTDWIYDNIFHFSEDQYQEYRDLLIEDQKRLFRQNQILEEGNDPAESGEAYGTPHSLASLYGAGRYPGSKGLPSGYDENDPNYPQGALGRPEEKVSDYGTQDSNLGKDPLGTDRMKSKLGQEDRPGLTVENLNLSTKAVFAKNEKMLKNMFSANQKVSLFEGEKLLDETQIREEVK
jgi:hypothetical protein|tara:strand:+ start:1716 stop:3632 length:1917 start_codon:yes stop_codon:yes gene_type:complete